MDKNAKAVVTEFLAAVQNGNNETLAALVSPEIKWEQPGNNQVSGLMTSAGEVFQMVGKMYELSDNSLRLAAIKSVTVNGSQVACLLQWTAAKANGSRLDVENVDVYQVANGQIVGAKIFTADLEAENKFWS